MKIAVSFHNLSSKKDRVERTGINQVVFNALKAALDSSMADIQLVPIFNIPKLSSVTISDFRYTHYNASKYVLERTFEEIGLSYFDASRRWPLLGLIPFESNDSIAYERALREELSDCAVFFELALVDNRPLREWVRAHNSKLVWGSCLHDFGPIVCPPYVELGMRSWFEHSYMSWLNSLDFTVSVSRATCLEWQNQKSSESRDYYTQLAPTIDVHRRPPETCLLGDVEKPYILSVATLEPRKNLDLLIKALERFEKIFGQPPPFKTVLVGPKGWNDSELLPMIRSRSDLVVTGYISNTEILRLKKSALALVLPSHYEGFGIPILDAVSIGVPVITCSNSALPESSQLKAHYVHPSRPDDLACLLMRMWKNQDKTRNSTVIKNGLSPVRDWENIWSEWIEIFKSVCHRSEVSTG